MEVVLIGAVYLATTLRRVAAPNAQRYCVLFIRDALHGVPRDGLCASTAWSSSPTKRGAYRKTFYCLRARGRLRLIMSPELDSLRTYAQVVEPKVARTGVTSATRCYVAAASMKMSSATCATARTLVRPPTSARYLRKVGMEIQHKVWQPMEVTGTSISTSTILCGAGDSACIAASLDVLR